MRNLRVVISSPIDSNLYSLLAAKMCLSDEGIDLVGVSCLRVLSIKRLVFEAKRLGPSLAKKIFDKYFLAKPKQQSEDCNASLVTSYKLEEDSLERLCKKSNVKFKKIVDPNDHRSIAFLSSVKPDLIISIGSVILRDGFISIPSMGVLNVHKGILPEYRGMGVTEWPLLHSKKEDEAELGVTAHLIERGVDTGPILSKRYLNIDRLESIRDIEPKYLEITLLALRDGLDLAKQGFSSTTIQAEDEGKQYFELHDRFKELVSMKLEKYFHGKK